MRKLFLVLIGTLLYTAAAIAEEWTPLAVFPTVTAEVDAESLRQTGSYFEVTFRFNHDSPQINRKSGEYLSAEVTSLFNCEKQTFAPIRRVEYKGKKSSGAKIDSVTVPNQQITFSKVLSGSMNQFMFDYVCSY